MTITFFVAHRPDDLEIYNHQLKYWLKVADHTIDLENNRGRGQKDYQVHHRIDDLESVDVVVQIVFGVAHCSDDLEN